ncbi:DUF4190 domain-containing protein [Paeniglutamicibacter sp. R2-26]|uniref:DUF4190 domain-containing protein n=1 Tax=Paeniglutamicibacter sp. R2-26 TaxID=3144417 RepID=UPI003EE43864
MENQLAPAPAPAPQPQAPAPKSAAGKGLGVAALVIAIVALTLSWVPIINNFAAVLGIVALALGIFSLVFAIKRNGGKGLGIASTIIAVVSIAMVFITQAAYSAALDSVATAIEDASDGEVAAPKKVVEQAADESNVLALGQSGEVGEYTVTVDSVVLDAAKQIAKANQFNEKADGQYVLVELSVVYNGDEEGDAWIDLSPELLGSDARIYDTSSASMAVAPKPATDMPTLRNGGKGTYQVVFDVPAAAVVDAKVRVTETLSFDDESALWATK